MSLRALYIQPAASFGGAERQAAQNIRLLPEFGVEVLPVVGPGRQIVDFLEDAGVDRFIFRPDFPHDKKAPRDVFQQAMLIANYVQSFVHLVDAIETEARRFGADLLYASRPFAWVLAGVVGERMGLPVVWRAGTHFEHWSQPALLSMFAKIRPPKAVVYTSSAIRSAIGEKVRAPAFVIHNGVDTDRFNAKRRVPSLRGELRIAGNAPVIGFVGRISPEKGTALLLDTCRELAARVPNVKLLLAGDSGWRGKLEEALAQNGLSKMVRILGFVREVERVYATADVVISTSAAEGCPNAILEAMAMGRAVAATSVGGTTEIIRDGVDGLLLPPGDARAFAEAVAGLIASPERRKMLGAQAAKKVAQHFSLRSQVARLSEVLHFVTGRELALPHVDHVDQMDPARMEAPLEHLEEARQAKSVGLAARRQRRAQSVRNAAGRRTVSTSRIAREVVEPAAPVAAGEGG